ncbi:MAG: hypothetical protein K2Y37_02830 [Pirellulales bacterium]|nr:hypothetical protein [Pirellulales bacterium]
MRLFGTWTAVFVLAAIVTAAGCGSSNMKPETSAGKMDDKMKSDGSMMDGKMSGDDKMKSDDKMSGEKK